jgi:hypothetical protein
MDEKETAKQDADSEQTTRAGDAPKADLDETSKASGRKKESKSG